MKNIFFRTLETTVKKINIIIAIVVGGFVGWLITKTGSYYSGVVYENCLSDLLLYQHLFIFFGLNGVVLICFIAGNTSGLIASEVHEGTFKLLAAKPNSRSTILLGKILGNVVGLIMLMALMLLSYYSAIVLVNNIDGNIIKDLVAYLPSYLIYGLIVIITYSSIGTLLSCVCKKKITALLPVLVLMIIAMGFFPIFRLITLLNGTVIPKAISYVDLNYQLALLFKQCVSIVGDIKASQLYGYLTNLFTQQTIDIDISGSSSTIWMANNTLSSSVVLVIYMLISAICYYFSFVIIKKKDI